MFISASNEHHDIYLYFTKKNENFILIFIKYANISVVLVTCAYHDSLLFISGATEREIHDIQCTFHIYIYSRNLIKMP